MQEEYENKLLDLARVSRVTAGGRRFSFRAVVVYGNKKGRVGVGVAKGKDVARGIEKAINDAKKHMIQIPIVDGTIPHMVESKYASVRLFLKPLRKGRGVIAGGPVRMVCIFGGIENISGQLLSRTKNKLNIARATIKALEQLKVERKSSNVSRSIKEHVSSKPNKEDGSGTKD